MTRTSTRILAALVVLAIAVLVSCSDDDSDQDDSEEAQPTPTTTTAARQSDTTTTEPVEEPTTTTVAAEGPEEWVTVTQGIYGRWADLLADPDPDQVSEIYAESCQCWDERYGTVEFLASSNEHIEGPLTQVLFVRHENTDESGLVDLTVRIDSGALRRVGADGETVQEIQPPDEELGCWALTILQDGPDDSWRVYSADALTGCPVEAQ